VLHGSGAARVKAGLHYIVVNLAASLLFLIGAALIYGVTGTLNMADLAQRVPTLATDDRLLFEIGAAILGVVFLVKAGAWPLNFWLAPAYSAAAAPVAAMFSMMTKVGFYALLRIGSLLAPDALTPFTGDTLFYGGIATLVFGILGILAAQELERVAAFCIVVSAGILLASLGLGGTALTGPLLFYMLSTVLATGAFFLLIGMIDRRQAYGAEVLAVTYEAFGFEDPKDPNEPDEVIGIAIPGAVAFLGMSFLACVLLVAGLPPLSGFVAKFMLLAAALSSAGTEVLPSSVWLLLATVLASGLACVIALSRIGIRVFWSAQRTVPRLRLLEAAPVAALVLICIVLAVKAGPVMQYLEATAQRLHDPATYINAVLPATLPSIPAPELAP
jgi:multicomponent K+:H+ antiporter subunit D